MGDPYFQQRVFGPYMSNAAPDWRNSLRRRGGSRRRLDLGIISLRNLLAHACRVGNEPYRIFAKSGAPAHLAHGRGLAAPGRMPALTSFMDSLRPSLGAVSNFLAFAIHGRGSVCAGHIFADEPLANPQVLDLRQVRLHS